MLRIGEFSELSSISIHMLRHYDKIGLLIPGYVDDISGYRYYNKDQLVQANQILAFKSMGLGLDEIKEMIQKQAQEINTFLQNKLLDKVQELEHIKDQIRQIEGILHTDQGFEDYALTIARKTMEPVWVAQLHGTIDAYPKEGILWGQLSKSCQEHGIPIASDSPAMAIYHGADDTGLMSVDVQFPLKKQYPSTGDLHIFQIPKRDIVSVVFKGSYSQIGFINTSIADWLENNGLFIDGQNFTIYHHSPGNCTEEASFITELCFPVREAVGNGTGDSLDSQLIHV